MFTISQIMYVSTLHCVVKILTRTFVITMWIVLTIEKIVLHI